MSYIMRGPDEPARIRFKTSPLLARHHLDWAALQRGESFVDFGCASGEVVREAAGWSGAGDVVGIDADPEMLAAARAASEHAGLAHVRYLQAEIRGPGSSGLPDARFDHAWARFFLEYQLQPQAVVREMARVVKPGGRVTLIDIDGNCSWHYPMPEALRAHLDEILEDLRGTGFDPGVGQKLRGMAESAGLVDVRESVEPYHYIVGRPDPATAEAWRRKLTGIRDRYCDRLFPAKAGRLRPAFDAILAFVLGAETMTWSNLHLVQGVRAT